MQASIFKHLILAWNLLILAGVSHGHLRPQDSETRQTKVLDGQWNFRLSPYVTSQEGFDEEWYNAPMRQTCELKGDCHKVMTMPVPSSYNDISTNSSVRDHVGWVWYDRTFYTPYSWDLTSNEVFIRFGSVHYYAKVWINGLPLGEHYGGHLPFQFGGFKEHLRQNGMNWITVAVNNTLTLASLPQGQVHQKKNDPNYPPNYVTLDITFDFFNYAGIHRSVVLHTVPIHRYISDVTVVTSHLTDDHELAVLSYDIQTAGSSKTQPKCGVELTDKAGNLVSKNSTNCNGQISVSNPKLWWPYTMADDPGYLHTLTAYVVDSETSTMDIYRTEIGIRSVSLNASNLMVNGADFYFRGFGRHEDSDIRGKGLDLPLIARDFELIKWIGANSFRTSHYPYAEEIMDMADQYGIVIVDECPGVALDGFSSALLKNHLQVMTELIERDKNRASVFVWSIANEPRSQRKAAKDYFAQVSAHTKAIDPAKRPVGIVLNQSPNADKSAESVDIVGINKYFAWYQDTGHLELITNQMENLINSWKSKHPDKAFFVSEYGADTVAGMHQLPAFIFTEEYQYDTFVQNFRAFDSLRHNKKIVGEMVWNFADFMTKQQFNRVVGNKKGIFTRQRQPKAAAHLMRRRYWKLAGSDQFNKDNTTITCY